MMSASFGTQTILICVSDGKKTPKKFITDRWLFNFINIEEYFLRFCKQVL